MFICVAAAVLVAASVVPHHHHGGKVCIELDGGGHDEHGGCVADTEYTDRLEREHDDDCACHDCFHLFFEECFCAAEPEPVVEPDCGESIIHYKSVCTLSVGLRAPPVCIF